MENRRGYTLVEAAIAMLLTAIMAGSVFSIALTAKRSSGRGLRKLIADQASRQLAEQLKNYVKSTDYQTSETVLAGPGLTNPGSAADPWFLNDTTSGKEVCDSCGSSTPTSPTTGCYALKPGSHTLTGYLPKWFESSPYGARMKYWVMDQTVDGQTMPLVNITADWKEI